MINIKLKLILLTLACTSTLRSTGQLHPSTSSTSSGQGRMTSEGLSTNALVATGPSLPASSSRPAVCWADLEPVMGKILGFLVRGRALIFVQSESVALELKSISTLPRSLALDTRIRQAIAHQLSPTERSAIVRTVVPVRDLRETDGVFSLYITTTLTTEACAFLTQLWHQQRNDFVADMRDRFNGMPNCIRLPSWPHWEAVIRAFLEDLQTQGVVIKLPNHPDSIDFEELFGRIRLIGLQGTGSGRELDSVVFSATSQSNVGGDRVSSGTSQDAVDRIAAARVFRVALLFDQWRNAVFVFDTENRTSTLRTEWSI